MEIKEAVEQLSILQCWIKERHAWYEALNMAISALEKQVEKKPLTNTDCIRAMTDEELVELCTNIDCECCKAIMHSKGCPANNWRRCEDFWLNWLKQEVTDEQ